MDKQEVANKGVCVYTKEGDPKSERLKTIWINSVVFGTNWYEDYNSILDVGSGNGRLNRIFSNNFSEIYNIDPCVETSSKFAFENVVYYKDRFEDFEFDRKFDVISFFFSLYLFPNKDLILEKVLNLLNSGGTIIIMEGIKWMFDTKKTEGYDIMYLCHRRNFIGSIRIIDSGRVKYIFALLKKGTRKK